MDVLRERDKGLERRHVKGQYVDVDLLATYVGDLDEMEEEKGANDEQEDAGELLAPDTPTVLAFWLAAPALAPAG